MLNTQNESQKAKQWRAQLGLSAKELSELTGYSPMAIHLFESGRTSKKEPHDPKVWQRYKLVCLAVMFMKEYEMNPAAWEWTT
jgi:predicted transcriptional regulator